MNSKLNHIMLVDDNEADNFVHEKVIKEFGCAEHIAVHNNGSHALKFLEQKSNGDYPKPGLIFLDISMPGMNAWEFLEAYEKLPGDKKGFPVVIILTTSLNPEDEIKAQQLTRIAEFMNKPLTKESLGTIIAKYFNDTSWWLSNPESPFHFLSEDVHRYLISRLKLMHFKKGDVIYREGFNPQGLLLVRSGKVKEYKTSDNDREVIIRIATGKDMLGYDAIINGSDYQSAASAIEDTELYFLSKEFFWNIFKNYPESSLSFNRKFINEYEQALSRLVEVVSNHVRKRIAQMLIELVKIHGLENDNKTINLTLSRNDMADLVATNVETLVRTLSEFKKEKLIEFKGKKITIINQGKLLKIISLP